MSEILVSVIIPLYNCERYISQAVESILNQTYKKIEIIVVDDGSTDFSLKVVKTFQDERIKIISRENGGLAKARNSGITEAKGEIAGFLDADDYWHPSKIETHIRHFKAYPEIGLSYSYSQFCDENSNLKPLIKSRRLIIFKQQIYSLKTRSVMVQHLCLDDSWHSIFLIYVIHIVPTFSF